MKKEIKINEVGQVMLTTDNGMLDYDENPKVVVNADDKFECSGETASAMAAFTSDAMSLGYH